MKDQLLEIFRKVAIAEGISFLVLLGIAMPIKYGLHIHWPVKIVGWAHGVLFITYALLLCLIWIRHRWPFVRVFLGGFAAFVPFGPFIFDKKILQLNQEV